jgi:hypothetical protein
MLTTTLFAVAEIDVASGGDHDGSGGGAREPVADLSHVADPPRVDRPGRREGI